MNTMAQIAYLRVIILTAACIAVALPSVAGPFDDNGRDFMSSLIVTGFEQDTWFGDPSAIALDDRAGVVYIADAKLHRLASLTLDGVPKPSGQEKADIESPVGLAVDRDGNLFISENDGVAIKFVNAKGEVATFEIPAGEGDQPPKPGRMVFDRDGNLYVVDRANSRICVFDKDRKMKLTVGGKGDKKGQFRQLHDVAVDRQGRIYALDSLGTPVQVFDRKGKYLYRFGFRGGGEEDIAIPSGIFVDRNGQVWVVDRGQHALKVFDRTGTFLRKFGSYGVGEGCLFEPIDAEMDEFGRVYVLEAGARRLQVFNLNRPFEPLTPVGL